MEEKYHITDSEWEIMRVVWANNEVTSNFVFEVLGEKMNWKRTTVKTLLNRLLERKILKKREIGNKYLYSTEYTEEEVAKIYILGTFKKICNTKVGKMIAYVIENSELSFDDLEIILKAVEVKKESDSMGLLIISSLVKDKLKGNLEIRSKKDRGTTIEFDFKN